VIELDVTLRETVVKIVNNVNKEIHNFALMEHFFMILTLEDMQLISSYLQNSLLKFLLSCLQEKLLHYYVQD